jgi:hypothetical protein
MKEKFLSASNNYVVSIIVLSLRSALQSTSASSTALGLVQVAQRYSENAFRL